MPEQEKKWRAYRRAYEYIDFTTCPYADLAWTTKTTSILEDSATNTYGTWKCSATATNAGYVAGCWDTNTSDYWRAYSSWGSHRDDQVPWHYNTLELPEGVAIKPSSIYLRSKIENWFKFSLHGYNPETQEWVSLWYYSPGNGNMTSYTKTITYTGDVFFTKFKLGSWCDGSVMGGTGQKYSGYANVTRLSIDKGTLRKG
jgi:hypothetical protein